MAKIITVLISIFFILINNLFLYKYGFRMLENKIFSIIILYTIILSFILFKQDFIYKVLKKTNSKYIFYLLTFFSLVLCLFITYTIDGNSLNVDRWSAMTVAIEALFKGEYPYTATDHLNGRTSNFPGLIVLGIPFYLLGNIGLLQVFSFCLFSFTIYKTMSILKSTYCLLLLFVSITFWYEVAVLSDFLSNILVVFSFILLWNFYFKKNIYSKPILLGCIISLLILTRGIVFIPIALYFFADFFKTNFKAQIKFSLTFSITSLLLIFLVLKDCPNKEVLLKFNPIILQTSYTPMWFNLLAIIVPLVCSFFIKNFKQYVEYVILINIILILNYFIKYLFNYGFQTSINDSKIDVVYLSYVFPFIWYFLSEYIFNEKQNSISK